PNIQLENQQIYDAYDTYICVGLPAGAIGNPGIAAIRAVLYPSETNYFYFYANIDTGVTYFAQTLEEHNANIEMVRQQQAEADALAEGEGAEE
ncbi:MAG: endolytic transglycosylase MltG, partial [Oscillospiraceae bacterium]|nr:endolytic transglycosylase MltG [Oscillospiraceae bacterium]